MCGENKGADQLCSYTLGFAYADCWFSDEAAHFAL